MCCRLTFVYKYSLSWPARFINSKDYCVVANADSLIAKSVFHGAKEDQLLWFLLRNLKHGFLDFLRSTIPHKKSALNTAKISRRVKSEDLSHCIRSMNHEVHIYAHIIEGVDRGDHKVE